MLETGDFDNNNSPLSNAGAALEIHKTNDEMKKMIVFVIVRDMTQPAAKDSGTRKSGIGLEG